MRGKGKGRWSAAALAHMTQSNGPAAEILRGHGVTAMSDVTGFGLLGHLAEILRPSGCGARLQLDRVPAMEGAAELLAEGLQSSLQEQNARAAAVVRDADRVAQRPGWGLLLDPQTSGGLVATLPLDQADDCIRSLHQAGYTDAAVIGAVVAEHEVSPQLVAVE